MRFIKIFFLVSFMFFHFDCENDKMAIEEYNIISLFVNRIAPYPLPVPSIDSKEDKLSKGVLDSIMKKEITIGINIEMESSEIIDIFKEKNSSLLTFNTKLRNFKSVRKIDISEISRKRNRKLVGYYKIRTNHYEFIDFDVALSFSRIIFSADHKHAIVLVGEYRSELTGNTTLYYLLNEDDKWIITDKKTLEIT